MDLALEVDRDLGGNDVAFARLLDRHRVVARRFESFDANPLARHAGGQQGILDHGHERTGTAEIGLGVLEPFQGRHDILGPGETLDGIEMVDQFQAAGICLRERLELGIEDDRGLVAIGVEQPHPARATPERALDQRHHRRDAAAAAEQQQRGRAFAEHEAAGRRQHVEGSTLFQGVVEPVRPFAAGHPLDRNLGKAVGFRGTRQGVAAVEGAIGRRHAEGQELPGPVAEFLGQIGRDIEDEGARIGCLLDDFGDAQLMIGHG